MPSDRPESTVAFVDGRDALAYLIIKPNESGDGVLIDAAANGMSKAQGAWVLRHVADQWDPSGTAVRIAAALDLLHPVAAVTDLRTHDAHCHQHHAGCLAARTIAALTGEEPDRAH